MLFTKSNMVKSFLKDTMVVRLSYCCEWFQRKTFERKKDLFMFIISEVPGLAQLNPVLSHEVRQNIRVARMYELWSSGSSRRKSGDRIQLAHGTSPMTYFLHPSPSFNFHPLSIVSSYYDYSRDKAIV